MRRKIRIHLARLGYYTKPHFMIIGVQKGGTSGLFHILKEHSCLAPSLVKEVHYFDNDELYRPGNNYYYHSFFPFPHEINKKTKVFEATPMYIYHPRVAERLYSYNPNLKLVLLLREPAERAFSAWTMYHHHFKTGRSSHLHDHRPFSTAVSEEIKNIGNESFDENRISFVKRGIYHQQLEKYLKFYKRDQILILSSKTLREKTDATLEKIQKFVGVPVEKLPFKSVNSSRVNEKDKYIKDFDKLKAFYKDHNEKLFTLIGKEIDWD